MAANCNNDGSNYSDSLEWVGPKNWLGEQGWG